jgi:hypothetical protein
VNVSEGHARCVPDEVVDRGLPRLLPDNTTGTATCLDACWPARGGDLTRKSSLSLNVDGRRSTRRGRRAISGPLATVCSGQPRLLESIKLSSSETLTGKHSVLIVGRGLKAAPTWLMVSI